MTRIREPKTISKADFLAARQSFSGRFFDQYHRIGADSGDLATPVAKPYKICGQAEVGNGASDLFKDHGYARIALSGRAMTMRSICSSRLRSKVAHAAPDSHPILYRRNAG